MKWVSRQYLWGQKVTKWHDWFAWYPVSVENNKVAWLETVQRKARFDDYGALWDYRSKDD